MPVPVKIKKLSSTAILPVYSTPSSAGADLCCAEEDGVTVLPGETRLIHTGLAVEIPEGYAGLIYARSGLALKKGLAPANKVGVIDSDYRGELMLAIHNQSSSEQKVEYAERIAQMIITPFLKADFIPSDELSDTVRGEGGFGSTGEK